MTVSSLLLFSNWVPRECKALRVPLMEYKGI